MGQIVRMKDIAEVVGVSTVTVSKALSGQRGVSESVRKEIEETAARLGYTYPVNRQERTKISYNIGILIADRYVDKYNTFYGNLQQLVSAEASNMKCFTMMEIVKPEEEKSRRIPRMLQDGDCDGCIVIGWMDEAYLDNIRVNNATPLVFLDFTASISRRDSVISDSFYGAYMLTNYLFSKGHEQIAYVGTVLSTSSITDRYLGYVRAMMEHGIEVKKEWVIDDRHLSTGIIDAENLLQLPDPLPTAFFCNSDLTASIFCRKLEELGYRCPEDVSIVGYDNFVFQAVTSTEFTTYEVDTKEMARKAVHNLIHKLNGEYYRKGVVIIAGRLVERKSVKDLTAKD